MTELSSMFAPNTRKLSLLQATLFPTLKKLIRNEHPDSFFPKGHPSPPKATRKVPSKNTLGKQMGRVVVL